MALMKPKIHPTYHANATITCVCGASFAVGSTAEAMEVEMCSQCHPFYTGEKRLIDTAGRVERFKSRQARAGAHAAAAPAGATRRKAEDGSSQSEKAARRKSLS